MILWVKTVFNKIQNKRHVLIYKIETLFERTDGNITLLD